jgi:hypothetical protein
MVWQRTRPWDGFCAVWWLWVSRGIGRAWPYKLHGNRFMEEASSQEGGEVVIVGLLLVGVRQARSDMIYWVDGGPFNTDIRRANRDGSGQETLVSGLQEPTGIALDTAAGQMYWTNFASRGQGEAGAGRRVCDPAR